MIEDVKKMAGEILIDIGRKLIRSCKRTSYAKYENKTVGGILIDIGRKLIRSSERASYVRYAKNSSKNKYNW